MLVVVIVVVVVVVVVVVLWYGRGKDGKRKVSEKRSLMRPSAEFALVVINFGAPH